jgi:hypothetical protein
MKAAHAGRDGDALVWQAWVGTSVTRRQLRLPDTEVEHQVQAAPSRPVAAPSFER